MGFGDFLGKAFEVGKDLFDKFMDYAESEAGNREKDHNRIIRLSEMMENKSDEELKRIYQTSSGDRKMAAGYILKQRGY